MSFLITVYVNIVLKIAIKDIESFLKEKIQYIVIVFVQRIVNVNHHLKICNVYLRLQVVHQTTYHCINV